MFICKCQRNYADVVDTYHKIINNKKIKDQIIFIMGHCKKILLQKRIRFTQRFTNNLAQNI